MNEKDDIYENKLLNKEREIERNERENNKCKITLPDRKMCVFVCVTVN